jgi:hypothetical protein
MTSASHRPERAEPMLATSEISTRISPAENHANPTAIITKPMRRSGLSARRAQAIRPPPMNDQPTSRLRNGVKKKGGSMSLVRLIVRLPRPAATPRSATRRRS